MNQASPAPAPDLQWSGLTHPGRVRPNNEDVFLALSVDRHEVRFLGKTGRASLAESDFVFAVSDGMGGAKSGEFASRIAVDRITRLIPRAFHRDAGVDEARQTSLLAELVSQIHHDLLKLGYSYEECAGMGATLSLCWFTQERVLFCHVGDSRIYHLPATGGLIQVSRDDTHVGWLRRRGELNEREARTHPRRNALQQALGAGQQFVDPQLGGLPYRAGDRFLLCSDGLTDGLWDRQLDEIIRGDDTGVPAANRLVHESVEASGRDNTTAVVIGVTTGQNR
jgi:serine/threonine protein phosphatase PrpC